MKLRTRAYLLGMLPALTLAGMLVPYLSASRLDDLDATLRNRGLTLAHYIAESAQYAVISGNVASMEAVLARARSEPDVVHMAIYRTDGNPVVTFGTAPAGLLMPLREMAADTPLHVGFSVPVAIDAVLAGDPFLPDEPDQEQVVAWVQLTMSRSGNERVARDMLVSSLIIVALGIVLTVALVHVLALSGVRPLMEIIGAVKRIGAGDLGGRLPLTARSELRTLQAGINQMSEALALSQQDMQARIDAATAELALQKEAAEQANLAKSKFLAAASHDLRQPLHALGLFTASLKQLVDRPEQRALVEKIEASVNGQEEMFDALLDLSRLEAGTLTPRLETFALAPVFERLARDFADQAREKGLRLTVRRARSAVRSDPMLLSRILSNLVSNALRYTERGGILVGARRRGARVCIQVWDTGIGITPDHLPKVFDEYFQVDNAARDRRRGLGLGLNIVHRLCALLDHPIDVRSRKGLGTVFRLTLPAGRPEDVDRRHGRERDWSRFDGQRVVVVEDDADARDALRGLLESWNLAVIAARGADEALDLARATPAPSLIISDYQLGGGETGIAVVRRLRQAWGADLPAVLVSGDTTAESVARMAASGLTVMHKPVRPARLRAWLQARLRG